MISVRAYAQLVRLPNVFTALADIFLGILAVLGLAAVWPSGWVLRSGLLLAASACLYSAGMIWNDVFDVEQDARERPFRPLPSGRIPRIKAVFWGTGLLALGWILAGLAGWRKEGFRWDSAVIGGLLVLAILLYDRWLKRTGAGPAGMGLCRFLNVLLGLSLAEEPLGAWGLYLAGIVGLYIVGVTWFARTEAVASSQSSLASAALVMLASLLLALPLPVLVPGRLAPPDTSPLFPYALVVLGFFVGLPVTQAISRPTPKQVQPAVKRAILGLVILDATLASALVGITGFLILLLLVPTLVLGRWIYST